MPRFAAKLSMLYCELDFLDRFAAACKGRFLYSDIFLLHLYAMHF
jgi:hydroxypyruvate isomerase